jgi:23S rRNA-/tRNA-specific pseudouridylate synthase
MGRVLVNGKQCTDPEYELRHNDTICHISHRHEPPIMDAPIEFIENNSNLLVINKPASMPVHSCAQYKIHTVVGMLWTRYGISGLRRMIFCSEAFSKYVFSDTSPGSSNFWCFDFCSEL